MRLEDVFDVTIDWGADDFVGKSIFVRQPFRLRDFAEIVYLRQGSGKAERSGWRARIVSKVDHSSVPFTQLSGCWCPDDVRDRNSLFEPIPAPTGQRHFRRRTDGMRCVLIPATRTTLGSDAAEAHPDERPTHSVELDAFLIDAEPVSTTAYCRFLNSIQTTDQQHQDWFLPHPDDDRNAQMQVRSHSGVWKPVLGTEQQPMVLVSWFGANAYSLWVNACDVAGYRSHVSFLPSEAQWEHAAQGAIPRRTEANSDQLTAPRPAVFGQHIQGQSYTATTLPMAAVHAHHGVSIFGLCHMAGNVWQWCRDWYADDFYRRPESTKRNPLNLVPTGVRSERGGSWVGPKELCRPTYRRGRNPDARGRCLGFRCIGGTEFLTE
jgi:formylglycine-generating enzyme required for sulfatase activity